MSYIEQQCILIIIKFGCCYLIYSLKPLVLIPISHSLSAWSAQTFSDRSNRLWGNGRLVIRVVRGVRGVRAVRAVRAVRGIRGVKLSKLLKLLKLTKLPNFLKNP